MQWPLDLPRPSRSPVDKLAKVATIRGKDLAQMTRDALDVFGGAASIIRPGDKVFIKPNLMAAGFLDINVMTTGNCTKCEIVIAVAEECLKAGAGKVIIGDGAQMPRFDYEKMVSLDSSTNMAAEVARLNAAYPGKVSLACLLADSPEWRSIPSPSTGLGDIRVSNLILDADRLISVPVIKTHFMTKFTASLKNWVGGTSTEDYGYGTPSRMRLHNAVGGMDQCLIDIAAGIKPDFAIIDGSICGEGNGPYIFPGITGDPVDMMERNGQWVILASDDLLAADITAARMIGMDLCTVKHLNMAYQQGLGQACQDRIELVGATLDELKVDWKPAGDIDEVASAVMQALGMMLDR